MKRFAVLLLIVCVILTGCSLAVEGTNEDGYIPQDRLVGVVVTTEYLDLFDADAFEQDPMEFYVVCTNAETGEPVYYKCTDGLAHDMLYVQGSASMSIVSRPVEADGLKLLDGGISDSSPVSEKCGSLMKSFIF